METFLFTSEYVNGKGHSDKFCKAGCESCTRTNMETFLGRVFATKLGARVIEVFKNSTCPWVMPDGRILVTVEYYNDDHGAMVPFRVFAVEICTQHDEAVVTDNEIDEIAAELIEHVVKPVIPEQYLDDNTWMWINPSARITSRALLHMRTLH